MSHIYVFIKYQNHVSGGTSARTIVSLGLAGRRRYHFAREDTQALGGNSNSWPASSPGYVTVTRRLHGQVQILRELSHPNVVNIYQFYPKDPAYYYVVLEYLLGGELFDRIVKKVR